jgi:hypothetical protein
VKPSAIVAFVLGAMLGAAILMIAIGVLGVMR